MPYGSEEDTKNFQPTSSKNLQEAHEVSQGESALVVTTGNKVSRLHGGF